MAMSDLAAAARAVLDRVDELERDRLVETWLVPFARRSNPDLAFILTDPKDWDEWCDRVAGWEHDERL